MSVKISLYDCRRFLTQEQFDEMHHIEATKKAGAISYQSWCKLQELYKSVYLSRNLEIQTTSKDHAKINRLLGEFFGTDERGRALSETWLSSKNPLLGGISPKEMIENGRIDRLIKFIEESMGV